MCAYRQRHHASLYAALRRCMEGEVADSTTNRGVRSCSVAPTASSSVHPKASIGYVIFYPKASSKPQQRVLLLAAPLHHLAITAQATQQRRRRPTRRTSGAAGITSSWRWAKLLCTVSHPSLLRIE